jgi:hypothetical protein
MATGLRHVRGEWVSDTLTFAALPPDWSEIEASQQPDPWLSANAHLHALRRMAIMADAGAVKLLLALEEGSDTDKQAQLISKKKGHNKTADRVNEAVCAAQAYLTVRLSRNLGA